MYKAEGKRDEETIDETRSVYYLKNIQNVRAI